MDAHTPAGRNGSAAASSWRPCARFAERVKLSGTPDELASMRDIQAQLEGYGYCTSLLMHDAYISLPGAAAVEIDGAGVPAITHSFSVASERLTAPVVYVGAGEFAGRDVRGCIVLAEGIASPAVADGARRAGAVGQLHISPHEHLHEMCISPVWGSPGLSTLAELPVTVACTVSHADGSALRDRLQRGEHPAVTLRAAVDTGWRQTPILVAELAVEADDAFILFSGHHDTWYFGVMDNGSANATMLECARVLAGQRGDWRRGLRLCFWSGHSHGRYSGSSWYVDTHWDELERRCAVHVNIDSTGGVGATVLHEAAAAAELTGLARQAVAPETEAEYEGRRNARNSDMSFWGVGIPSMFGSMSHQPPSPAAMRNALGWWWHTPHDLLDKIDEANLVRDTRIFVRTLWHLLTEPVLPLDYAAHAGALLSELERLHGAMPLDAPHHRGDGVARQGRCAHHLGARPGADQSSAHAALPRPGADGLYQRRPLHARPGVTAIALAGAGPDSGSGHRSARPSQVSPRWMPHARCNRLLHGLRQAGRAMDAVLA